VGLERGPLSLGSTIEELLGRKKNSGSGLERREHGRRDPSRWPCDIVYPQKLALTSLTNVDRSVCIVRSLDEASDLFFDIYFLSYSCKTPSLMRGWVYSLQCNHSVVRAAQNQ
jgi:hypothetical protein